MANNDKTFDSISDKLTKPTAKVAAEYADEFIVRVKKRTPYPPGFNPGSGKKVTGKLKRSWGAKGVNKNGGTIFNDADYAQYVDKGTEKMNGAHMVAKTINESDIITKLAWKRAKRK